MKKHLFTALLMLTAFSVLPACSEQEGQKAAVDVKPAADSSKAPVAAPAAPVAAKPAPASKVPPVPGPNGSKPGPAQTAAKVVDDPPPALSVPPGFRFESRGRRDPFVNPIAKTPEGTVQNTPVPVIRPDGLPGVLVSEVKLSGIIHSPDQGMNKAMLVVGRNTYFARKGDSLFDGVIKEIRPNEVVFSMVSATTKRPINRDTVVRTGARSGTSAGEMK